MLVRRRCRGYSGVGQMRVMPAATFYGQHPGGEFICLQPVEQLLVCGGLRVCAFFLVAAELQAERPMWQGAVAPGVHAVVKAGIYVLHVGKPVQHVVQLEVTLPPSGGAVRIERQYQGDGVLAVWGGGAHGVVERYVWMLAKR